MARIADSESGLDAPAVTDADGAKVARRVEIR